ncbi:hypothetical protein V5O48_013662 [Marasmius crinis-equi]|uniref:Uncharacterized protein n=1 Tax=Marasmius crinis-equi TaxID=585013 RepID=A0ABR3EZH2_9AGAR
MPFSQAASKLVSIFIQTLLYGAYVAAFTLTYWVLVSRRASGQKVNYTMLGISITMFVLATMVCPRNNYHRSMALFDHDLSQSTFQHIGVNFTRVFVAFTKYSDRPGGPAAFFDELSEFTQVFGSAIYVAQTLVGDGVVLFRCYLVWGRKWHIIAFPAMLLLGSTAAGIGILYTFARVTPQAQIFAIQLQSWIVSFFSLTLATNLICTTMVASRIWYINRATWKLTERSLNPVVMLVIESGAIYSATLITLLILYKAQSWFQYVLLDAISPIVGLVFSMIIVRIGLGITLPSGQTRFSTQSTAPTIQLRGNKDVEAQRGPQAIDPRAHELEVFDAKRSGPPRDTSTTDLGDVEIAEER